MNNGNDLCSSSADLSTTNMADSSTEKLIADATKLYEANFGSPKGCAVVYAPGRVNIIGEHVDYNGGFCLPVALLKKTVVVGRGAIIRRDQADTAVCRVASTSLPEIVEFKANGDLKPGVVKWANYVKGVVAAYLEDVPPGYSLSFDAAIASDVPMGGGLSSSAALEVSTATLLEEITRVNVGGVQRALRCQSSDHNFMGVKCGIMDQFVSSLASEGTALLVDCSSNAYERVPLDDDAVVLVVADSGVKHCNADGSYSERVKQCEMAVQAIKKRHPNVEKLRDASPAWVQEIDGEVDQKVFKRARHVVSEDRRTLCCAMAFRRKDYKFVGGCMNDSHASLKDDYEVSISELDELVSIAMGVDGVYGSRMTGGGFGGSTVTLVKRDAAELLMTTLREQYFAKTGKTCVCFVTSPCEGAGVIVPLRRPRRLLHYTLLSAAAFVTILVSSVVKLRPGGSSGSATR